MHVDVHICVLHENVRLCTCVCVCVCVCVQACVCSSVLADFANKRRAKPQPGLGLAGWDLALFSHSLTPASASGN